jgi:hypothetical protein
LLEGDPALDIVFLGVKGFGKYAKHFARAQSKSLQTVLRELKGIRPEQEVIKFGPELFDVLLKSVPQHFQHIMARRAKWLSIDRLRKKTYYLDPAILDEDSFRRCITAPRSDSEFAIYASLSLKTALINRPLYLFRCDGQGFISRPSQKTRQIESQVRITRHLFLASRKMPEFMSRKKQIRASLARVYFSAAYHFFYEGNRAKALKFLSKSAWVQPRFLCIKFGARMLLPRSW